MPNPTYVNSGTDNGGGGDTFSSTKSINIPSGASAGMMMEITAETWTSSAEPTVTNWAGFTEIAAAHTTMATTSSVGNQSIRKAWKRLTAGDISTGSFTITYSATTWNKLNAVLGQNVASSGDPVDAANTATGTTGYPTASVTASGAALLTNSAATTQAITTTPPTGSGGWTERQDADVLHTNTKEVSSAGTVAASGGTVSANTEICVATVAYKGDSALSDAGLWAYPPQDLVIPDNPLFFPFTTPWSVPDQPLAGATGSGLIIVRSVIAAAGQKAASTSGAISQRSTASSSGQHGASATVSVQARSLATALGSKQASGTGSTGVRCATSSSGLKGGASTSAAIQRSSAASAGTKQVAGVAATLARAVTAATSSVGGASRVQQRAVTSSAGSRQALGASGIVIRAAVVSTGLKGAAGASSAMSHCTSTGASKKSGSGVGATIARSHVLFAGTRSATGSAAITCRSDSSTAGLRATAAATAIQCRTATGSIGSPTPIPVRDLTLAGSIEAGRFTAKIEDARMSGSVAPHLTGDLEWPSHLVL